MTKGTFNGKLSDPQWRKERARKAAQARNTPDKLITQLEKLVDQLTEEDRARLRHLAGKPPSKVAGIQIGS